MKALLISEDLLKEINNKEFIVAKVHSVFNNACNLEFDEKLITILTKDKVATPMSVIVDNSKSFSFKALEIPTESKFIITKEEFTSSILSITLKEVEVYNPYIEKLKDYINYEQFNINLILFQNEIMTEGKLGFFYPLIKDLKEKYKYFTDNDLNSNCHLLLELQDKNSYIFIKERFLSFIEAYANYDKENIQELADKIIGFGLGLTPSIDDFISGLIISLIYLGDYYNLNRKNIYEFNSRLIQNSKAMTTKVSYEMLKHSAKGLINSGVKNFMTILLTECHNDKITKALKEVMTFGETSGSDTAFGIYIGCKLITDINYRRKWE